ncbi:hypothetical protein GHT06_018374 [Daphnia sinensis]|uniref:Uncharacterized protein n=1 Tax=Daphnia sinensis TaxID=1820382 RepID=A0AAD5PQ38_9CRUS|nr:hypothetical protein GHT06_018374 [Daphnia sinensis]
MCQRRGVIGGGSTWVAMVTVPLNIQRIKSVVTKREGQPGLKRKQLLCAANMAQLRLLCLYEEKRGMGTHFFFSDPLPFLSHSRMFSGPLPPFNLSMKDGLHNKV